MSCVPSITNEDIVSVITPEGIDLNIVPDTEETQAIIEEMQTEYRLVIHYVYEDGTPAYDDYIEVLQAGVTYEVTSPLIDGYIVSDALVSGVMPKRNVERTVFYLTRSVPMKNIADYNTPLGLGWSMMNVGISVE